MELAFTTFYYSSHLGLVGALESIANYQQQFFSELHSPGRSHYTNYWYSWVQTIYFIKSMLAYSVNKEN